MARPLPSAEWTSVASASGPSPVVQAALEVDILRLERELNRGSNPNAQWNGHDALAWAILGTPDDTEHTDDPSTLSQADRVRRDLQARCVEALLTAKADLNTSSIYTREGVKLTPLMLACARGRDDIVDMLLDVHARESGSAADFWTGFIPPKQDGSQTMTPLMVACAWGQLAVVNALLARGCPTMTVLETNDRANRRLPGDEPTAEGDALYVAVRRAAGFRVQASQIEAATRTERARDRQRAGECALAVLRHDRATDPANFHSKQATILLNCCVQHISSQNGMPAWQLEARCVCSICEQESVEGARPTMLSGPVYVTKDGLYTLCPHHYDKFSWREMKMFQKVDAEEHATREMKTSVRRGIEMISALFKGGVDINMRVAWPQMQGQGKTIVIDASKFQVRARARTHHGGRPRALRAGHPGAGGGCCCRGCGCGFYSLGAHHAHFAVADACDLPIASRSRRVPPSPTDE